MIGRPTLLAIFPVRLDAHTLLDALKRLDYGQSDVSVYYRLRGTDGVIDAVSGKVPAGQTLTEADFARAGGNVDTLVLMHPAGERLAAVRGVFATMGAEPVIMYAGKTTVEGRPGGVERHDEGLEM